MPEIVTEVVLRQQCTGCSACMNSCPVDAIEMNYNAEGFLVPQIAEKLCIKCSICYKKCPVVQVLPKTESELIDNAPTFYGGWSLNETVVKASSSGGVFTELARYVLEQKGKVYGARWINKGIEHWGIDSIADIGILQGSKYLQSKIGFTYRQIKNDITSGKKVLFVGTPCQVAGLNSYFRHKNLITADLTCHGVPSYIVYKKYIELLDHPIEWVNFRDKTTGWSNYSMSLHLKNNSVIKSQYNWKNPFYIGFLKDIYLNSCCYQCSFSCLPRTGDITLGDFWGVPAHLSNHDRGTSVIIANNLKGYQLLQELISKKQVYLEEVNKEQATLSNPRLVKGQLRIPVEREKILSHLDQYGFKDIQEKYISLPSNKYILKFYLKKFIKKYLKS